MSRANVSTQTCQTQQMFTRTRVFQESEKKESAGEIAISAKAEPPRHGQREKMHRVASSLNVLSL